MFLAPGTDVAVGLLGGALVGLSSSMFLVLTGKLTGISGIVHGWLTKAERPHWRLFYIAGLASAGVIMRAADPAAFGSSATLASHLTPTAAAAAGLLVGFGTRLGSGCTSGHGVCGLPRRSLRSLVSVGTFMAAGSATAWLARSPAHLQGRLFAPSVTLPDAAAATMGAYLAPTLGLLAVSFIVFHLGGMHRLLTGYATIPPAEEPCLNDANTVSGGDSSLNDEEPLPPAAPVQLPPDGSCEDASDDKNSGDGSEQPLKRRAGAATRRFNSAVASLGSAVGRALGGATSAVMREVESALEPHALVATASAYACGLLFGVALGVSGMTNPEKVAGFLDATGHRGWDLTLAGVFGGAVVFNSLSFAIIRDRMAAPIFGESGVTMKAAMPVGSCPANNKVDGKLVVGAVMFGAGWGLSGLCPGPAIVALAAGSGLAGTFAPAMLAGMLAYEATLGDMGQSTRRHVRGLLAVAPAGRA